MLHKLADLVEQHAEEFALLETLVSTFMIAFALLSFATSSCVDMQDTGKPFQAAMMMDIPGFQFQVRHNAGYAN